MSLTESQLRSVVQDPSGANQILSATDYSTAISLETNNFRQLSLICRMLAAAFARKVEMTAGSVRMANNQKFQHYMEMSKQYDLRSTSSSGSPGSLLPVAPGILISDIITIESDINTQPASFTQDMKSESFNLGINEDEYA